MEQDHIQLIINGYEKQATKLFRIIILLLLLNICMLCVFYFKTTEITIDLDQINNKNSQQFVEN